MSLSRSIGQVASGAIAGVINDLLSNDPSVWVIKNLDFDEDPVVGQFGPENLSEEVGSNFVEFVSLGQTQPIVQFTNGKPDVISFDAFFFALHEGPPESITGVVTAAASFSVESFVADDDTTPADRIAKLKEWSKYNDDLKRPPHVSFIHGDGSVSLDRGYLQLGAIRYFDPPKASGGIRGVRCAITIRSAPEFSLEAKFNPWTRYHNAKEGDYYEMLAYQEYRAPLLGDVIRRLHPEKQVISEGEIIMLPSVGAISKEVITQKSITFKGGFGAKETDQRTLRETAFTRNSSNYISGIVPTGL